jgi:hypothetical protein
MTRFVAVVAALLVVAGCSSSTPDERFVRAVASTPAGVFAPEPDMRRAGRAACAEGTRGGVFDEAAATLAANRALGLPDDDGRGYDVAYAAQAAYCRG